MTDEEKAKRMMLLYRAIVDVCQAHGATSEIAIGAVGAMLNDIPYRAGDEAVPPQAIAAILVEGFAHFGRLDIIEFLSAVADGILKHAIEDGHKGAAAIYAASTRRAADKRAGRDVEEMIRTVRVPQPVRRRFSRRPR